MTSSFIYLKKKRYGDTEAFDDLFKSVLHVYVAAVKYLK